MPSLNFLNSFWNLFVPCLNFITEGFGHEHEHLPSSTPTGVSDPPFYVITEVTIVSDPPLSVITEVTSASDPPLSVITEVTCVSDPPLSVITEVTSVSDLPLSVIIEVFSKLPIKSIIQCRCVCKSWFNITCDPYFATCYYANPPFTTLVLSQHRIVADRLSDESFYFLEFGTNGRVNRTPFNPKALNFHRHGVLSIMDSCNGLLCVVQTPQLENRGSGNQDRVFNKQSVHIINPLLGEFTTLPRAKRAKKLSNVVYCFGSNRSSDSYKALRFFTTYVNGGRRYEVGVEILTIGVDEKWRPLKFQASDMSLFPCGICLNGIIHWVGGESPSGFILAFHIEEERWQFISLPPGLGEEPKNIVMAVRDEKLCFADNSMVGQVVIWTMKKYGFVESWSREIILKSRFPSELRPYRFVPIATLTNGDLLMLSENEGDVKELRSNHFVSFNPKTKACIKHEVSSGGDEVGVFFFHGYTPRLFPGGLSL